MIRPSPDAWAVYRGDTALNRIYKGSEEWWRDHSFLDFLAEDLDARVSFARASTKSYYNSAGVLQQAASGAWPLEYDPVTLAPRGRSIWEQRTNLFTYSNDFTGPGLHSTEELTITPGYGVAPNGAVASTLLVPTTTSGIHRQRREASGTGAHSFSIFARAAGYRYLTLVVSSNPAQNACFDLVAGAVASAPTSSTDVSVTPSARIQNVGNGWYRCTYIQAPGAILGMHIHNTPSASNSYTYAGDGISGIEVFGVQWEASATSGPYIPTTTAQVTRAADAVTVPLSLVRYNAAQQTFRARLLVRTPDPARQRFVASLGSNGRLAYFPSNNQFPRIYDGTTVIAGSAMPLDVATSVVSSFGPAGLKVASAGGGVNTGAYDGGFEPGATTLTLGAGAGSTYLNDAWLQSISMYPRQLSDAAHQALAA